jgi:small subunit ribosomal protein S17
MVVIKTKKAISAKKENEMQHVRPTTKKDYSVRGNIFEGIVISAKSRKTVTVEREIIHYIPKYERYLKIRSRVRAHNPDEIAAREGDKVKIGETRRISKTKSFLVLEIIQRNAKRLGGSEEGISFGKKSAAEEANKAAGKHKAEGVDQQ